MLKRLKNEEGNTTIIVLIILMAAILMSFVFFDMFTTYVTKRVSQSAADAAAIAASQEMKKTYQNEMREHINNELEDLRSQLETEVENIINEENERRAEEEEEPLTDDEIDSIWEAVFDNFNIVNDPVMRDFLRDPSSEIEIEHLLWIIGNDRQVTRFICDKIYDNRDEIREAARRFAVKNGADEDIEIVFPYNFQFEVQVGVKRQTTVVALDDYVPEDNRDIYTSAAARIGLPGDVTFHVNHCRQFD